MQTDGSFEFIGGPADTFYLDGYPICHRQVEENPLLMGFPALLGNRQVGGAADIGHLLTTCVLLGVLAGMLMSRGFFQKLLEDGLHPVCQKEDEDTPLDQLVHSQELLGFQGY